MNRMRLFFICLLISLVNACGAHTPPLPDRVAAPPPPPPAKAEIQPVREEKTVIQELFAGKQIKDDDLFLVGLSLLPEAVKKDDYSAVKISLDTLIKSYPESKRIPDANAILRLIGSLESYREKSLSSAASVNKNNADKLRVMQEIEQMKKDSRLLTEKSQAEISALQQENEQLKKDIQLLKNLEMQLDKREKLLR
jgi:hypothetical protein